jgi:signal peptidase I
MVEQHASSALEKWSRWRKHRRITHEALQLCKEGRRILRKYQYRIKETVAEEVSRAIEGLQEACEQKRFSHVRERLEKLDDLIETHLSFGRKSTMREYAESIGIAVLVALFLRAFVVEAFKIPSGSMIPTLKVGDHLFVNKFIYGFRVPFMNVKFLQLRPPQRGEVIVFVYPKDQDKDFIKRIVAVGGDTIAVRNNTILINGQPIKRKRLPGPCMYYQDDEDQGQSGEIRRCIAYEEELGDNRYRVYQNEHSLGALNDFGPQKIPPGQVFVMGDNRDNSHDSRFWGGVNTVPESFIKGRAIIIWWSYGHPEGIRWKRFFHRVHSEPDEKMTVDFE